MIQFLELNNLAPAQLARLMKRAETDIQPLFPLAQDVINQIRIGGDAAVVKFVQQFDAKDFTVGMLRATKKDFDEARSALSTDVIQAIEKAHDNIAKFHAEQMPESMWFTEVQPGIMAGERITPVASAG